MNLALVPQSLRFRSASGAGGSRSEFDATPVLTAVCVLAASSGAAEAQQASSSLPAVTVDAPAQRPRVALPKASQAQIKARTTLRRKVREARTQQTTPVRGPAPATTVSSLPTFARAPDANPYADPAAPYKADRLSSSGKFPEPLLNTPRTVTVLTKEVLADKNATSLKEVGRSTAGVTLGSGEGGNAFGDRFFIRGFDARNDIFVDGVRDPGVSIRENFFTEQVEILRGPASSFAGRGTTGGAINIVTKKAGDTNFANVETTLGSDQTKRLTIDVNRAISPVLDVRINGMVQGANVAGRDYASDNRTGIAGAVTFKPIDTFTLTADYAHTFLYGTPDFGVPYDPATHRPITEGVVPRTTYYGIINRDFTQSTQNIGTLNAEWKPTDWLTLENKFRQGYSILNYIGTIPENPSASGATAPFSSTSTAFSGFVQLNAQSRYETAAVLADQPQATVKFDTGPIKHVMAIGGDFSSEKISIDTYTGLTSELTTGPVAFASSGAPIVSAYNPINTLFTANVPHLTGNPLRYNVDTNAVYLIDTMNYHDKVILNGGVRFDDYHITAANNTASNSDHSPIVSYNVGLTLKPLPITSVYAAYATAADPVGDELDATSSTYGGFSPTQTQILGPQKSEAIEVGNKWELFGRHLLASGAAFQTTVTNARETVPNGVSPSTGLVSGQIIGNAAYKVQGLDFEVAGKITDKWSVIGGLVLMDPKVTKSINPANVGLPLANIANRSLSVLSKYQVTHWFEIGGQAVYDSQIYGGSLLAANGGVAFGATPSPTVLPSHWRFDTFVEAKIGPNTALKLYVQNVFNRTYYDALYQSGQPFIQVAPGRTVSLIATAKF